MQVDENGLNDRQRRFASLIVKGHPAKVAYDKAFPSAKLSLPQKSRVANS
jgi:hypothetical protein